MLPVQSGADETLKFPVTEAVHPPVRFDFYQWQKDLIDRGILAQLSGGAAKLLFALGRFANRQGKAFPSRMKLMQLSGLKVSGFKAAMARLIKARLVRRRKRTGQTVLYTLITDFDPGLFAPIEDAELDQSRVIPKGHENGPTGALARPLEGHENGPTGALERPQNNVWNKGLNKAENKSPLAPQGGASESRGQRDQRGSRGRDRRDRGQRVDAKLDFLKGVLRYGQDELAGDAGPDSEPVADDGRSVDPGPGPGLDG